MSGGNLSIAEFAAEAKEHLSTFASDLLAIEKAPASAARERLDRVFRAVHSIKGGAGFFGRKSIEELAHALETLLEPFRSGDRAPDTELVDVTLAAGDVILSLLDDVERSNEVDTTPILKRLNEFSTATATPSRGDAQTDCAALGQETIYELRFELLDRWESQGQGPVALSQLLAQFGKVLEGRLEIQPTALKDSLPKGPVTWRVIYSSTHSQASLTSLLSVDPASIRAVGSHSSDRTAAAAQPPPAVPGSTPRTEPPHSAAPPTIERSSTLRINIHLLDRLVNLTSELVLVRNQALQSVGPEATALRGLVQRLSGVTSEIQDVVMRTRLQPVGNLFGKFPRMVRDLARQLGKEIELEISGQEVELDKTILEALSDPLTHLLRNSCDHGVERPEARLAAGKPSTGRVWLRARHEAGQIHIDVEDDGRGLDSARLKRKALEKGLRTALELESLSEKDSFALILEPGFSTAEAVTDVSGRGVGMDVVRTNIEQLGGHLDIDSTTGQGSAFHLRLPLTLAILPGLLVKSADRKFVIPLKDIEELIGLDIEGSQHGIETAHDREMIRRRGVLMPVLRLDRMLGGANAGAGAMQPSTTLVVLRAGARSYGLVVDEVLDTQEIVVKPMHGLLRSLTAFSGATILGDGQVALLLDVEGIARVGGAFRAGPRLETSAAAPEERERESQAVLLFRSCSEEQLGVPLGMVRRIERIARTDIQRVGEEEFAVVGGVETAIARLQHLLPLSNLPDPDSLFLILPRRSGRPMGVLASEILDTLVEDFRMNTDAVRGEGIVGTAVVRGRLTIFLDLYRLADRIDPTPAVLDEAEQTASRKPRVLLVDDTQFFRQVVRGYLEADGYRVDSAINGEDGLEKLAKATYDLVISDIEMPVLDGWGFAQRIRQDPRWRGVPLLALTTLSSERDRVKALECGFTRYEVKLDRERLLASAREILNPSAARS